MSKFVVGLTGGIGSGKTTVTNAFSALGIDIIDADILSREVVEPGADALVRISEHFGPQILDAKGKLDRSQLRQIVFATPAHKEWLEKLLHPLIRDLMLQRINCATSPYCILVSPLLLETDQANLVNRILVVDVSEETQLQRTLVRDGSDEQTIKSIIAAQIDRKSRLAHADDVISNETEIADIHLAVMRLHENYLKMSSKLDDD